MWVRFCVASALVLHIQSLGHISEEQIRSPCDQVIEGLRCRATQSCVIPAWVIHSRNLLSSSKKQDSSSGVMARLHMLNESVIIPHFRCHSRTPCLRITHFRTAAGLDSFEASVYWHFHSVLAACRRNISGSELLRLFLPALPFMNLICPSPKSLV